MRVYFCNSTKLNFGSGFDNNLKTLQEEFKEVYTARAKLEAKLSNINRDINNSTDKQDRKIKIECVIVKSKDAFSSVIEEIEELFELARGTEDPDSACKILGSG